MSAPDQALRSSRGFVLAPVFKAQPRASARSCGSGWEARIGSSLLPAVAAGDLARVGAAPCLVQAVPGLPRAPMQGVMLYGGGPLPPSSSCTASHQLRAHRNRRGVRRQSYCLIPRVFEPGPGQPRLSQQSQPKFRYPLGPLQTLPCWPRLREKTFIPGWALRPALRPAPTNLQEPGGGKGTPVRTRTLHLIETALLYAAGCGLPPHVSLPTPTHVTPASLWAVETAPMRETPLSLSGHPLSLVLSHGAQELASCVAKP